MKTHLNMVKGKGTTRVNNQQVAFELKHHVLLALNKIADRDTYLIGVEELDKIIESLTPNGIAPFLSCILDTDSEQKSAIRKECIRSIGTLVTFYKSLLLPHLGKMIASIVKRLKDTDSIVRDACVDTVGVLASELCRGSIDGANDGLFVALVKPLFEALGEQTKQVQSGSALCLTRVIDNIHDPPVSIMQKMLARTVKLLKNPHFMAKPAVIELNRSIIQAGGAPRHSILSAAIASIQEALKNSDWTTRKAASAALGEIASSDGACFGSFKSSSMRCLESCRFDKVKPVRDTALQALQIWRSIPGLDTPDPSEAGSSIKENFYRDEYVDATSVCESTPKDASVKKFSADFPRKTIPLSFRKSGQSIIEKAQHSKADDWRIEIAVPKTHNTYTPDVHYEESEDSSITKMCERSSSYLKNSQDVEYEYVHVDKRQECSSASNLSPKNFQSKALAVCSDVPDEVNLVTAASRRPHFSTEEKPYSAKMRDRQSLDSTVTESSSNEMHGCCSQRANEIAYLKKQLLDIESKQSSLMDLLKVFTSNIMDSLSVIQLKVSSLEDMVDGMSQEFVHGGRYTGTTATRTFKRSQECSPRISTYTPRPSIDMCNRQTASLPLKSVGICNEKVCTQSRSSAFSKQGGNMWTDSSRKLNRSSILKGTCKQGIYGSQTRKTDNVFARVSAVNGRQNSSETNDSLWSVVKGWLSEGDLESGYREALNSGNEPVLFKLLDRTGPVLENLSQKTASDLLSILASQLFKQRFANSIFPWLQQMVDLITIHGPEYLAISAKVKREILSAVQKAVEMKFSNPAERRSAAKLAMALQHLWGQCSS